MCSTRDDAQIPTMKKKIITCGKYAPRPVRSSARYIATPTTEPAVPGAFGTKPAPAAVATAIASQSAEPVASLFVFTISIGSVNFFGRPLGCGYAISPSIPPAEANQLAAPAAQPTVGMGRIFGLFL